MHTKGNKKLLKKVAKLLNKRSNKIYKELMIERTYLRRRLEQYRRASLAIGKADSQWLMIQSEVDRLTVEVLMINRQIKTLLKLKYETFEPFYSSDIGIYPS